MTKWYFTKGHVSVKMYLLQKCYRKITNMELEALQERDLRIQKELEVCSRICGKSFFGISKQDSIDTV